MISGRHEFCFLSPLKILSPLTSGSLRLHMPESDDTRWGSPSFSPQAWLNASLREASSRPPDAGPAEPLGVRLSVLLTKLQQPTRLPAERR